MKFMEVLFLQNFVGVLAGSLHVTRVALAFSAPATVCLRCGLFTPCAKHPSEAPVG